MGSDPEKSLSDEATFAGAAKRRPASEVSIGDERTLGDNRSGRDTIIDDIEVVDLKARYRVEGTLGQGGMGAVLLATDTRLDRKVAIKRILGEAAGNRMAVQRFLTEAKSIAALNHPNIVQIYDYGRAKDGPFLIMEYVDGGSLLERCCASALPLDEAIALACQLCEGLAKAHDLGIIHRDIKPANVLLTKDGIPKLTDFGLAKAQASDHGQTMTGAVLGTPDFMPPEQRRDASLVDHRSDLWSLAATVYQMATGRSPKIVRLHEVPQALQTVLAKALEDEKHDRYQSAAEFRQAIRSAMEKPTRRQATNNAELTAGECPRCHEPNEAHRKFCRNPECAASLRVPCLAETCGHEIPVWDKVCPECGAKQPELVSAKANGLTASQEAAERDLANLDFTAATDIAESLSRITDIRFGDFQEWGRAFRDRVATEKAAADEMVAARVGEARRHQAAYDYAAAIQAVESLPKKQHWGYVATLLQELREQENESKQLLETIKTRIANRDLEGLLDLSHRALSLRGDRADLRKLVAQLEEREARLRDQRSKAFASAQRLLEAGDAKAAMEHMAPFSTGLAPDQIQFKELLQRAVSDEEKLSQLLTFAKADGTITREDVVLLAHQVVRCLETNPNHPKITALRQQLVDRIEKKPADFASKVEALMPMVTNLGGASSLPGHFRRLLQEHDQSRAAAQASEQQRQSRQLRSRLSGDLAHRGKPSSTIRETLKEEMRKRFGSDRVRCPICNVECKASRLVKHFDEQHYGK